MNRIFGLAVTLALATMVAAPACATGPKVRRVDDNTRVDVSGRFNADDAKAVFESLTKQFLESPWIGEQMGKEGAQKPRISVGRVINRTLEHIQTDVFVNQIRDALIRSGRVAFVADPRRREELRKEKLDQTKGFTDDDSRTSLTGELGATYVLAGQIDAIVDKAGGTSVTEYWVTLELYELETNVIVWSGKASPGKRIVERSRYAP